MAEAHLFAGLISGTSVDGIDCALVDFACQPPRLVATHCESFTGSLRSRILQLCSGEAVTLQILGETDIAIAHAFADATQALLRKAAVDASQVTAIGSHGQTVHHSPNGDFPFTLQLGEPATLAELTGISTVADFRSKDMAAGGQGAPLAPLFHQFFFYTPHCPRLVLNLGGISNVSILAREDGQSVRGFDCGPANVLMDGWISSQRGQAFDEDGQWAASGKVNKALLEDFLREPYFAKAPPKSTGRELFNAHWLAEKLQAYPGIEAQDVQATLLELTAQSIAEAIARHAPDADELVVCGGGAHNTALMSRLSERLDNMKVFSSEALGLSPDWVEAVTFAWLARQCWLQQAVDCRQLTGARHPCILGGIYQSEPGIWIEQESR